MNITEEHYMTYYYAPSGLSDSCAVRYTGLHPVLGDYTPSGLMTLGGVRYTGLRPVLTDYALSGPPLSAPSGLNLQAIQ